MFGFYNAPKIISDTIYLRPPKRKDKRQWLQLRYASKEHLENWEADYGKHFASPESFDIYFRHIKNLLAEKRGEGWLMFNRNDNAMIGSFTISNMRFGAVQSADIGYWIGAGFAGKGNMKQAMPLILRRIFQHHKLRRAVAATLPENTPSRLLLEKFGFQREGIARQYLHINGSFKDHDIYALVAEDYFANFPAS